MQKIRPGEKKISTNLNIIMYSERLCKYFEINLEFHKIILRKIIFNIVCKYNIYKYNFMIEINS